MVVADPGYQLLACRFLRKQLDVLRNELGGVRANEDSEPVHQARVASRRIRAALRMFAGCFDAKTVQRWQRQVKRLTRELGAARDKDVQIEFVEGVLARLDEEDRRHRPGINRLLLRLRQSRAALQPEVIEVLDSLDKKHIFAQMCGYLEEVLFTLRSHEVQACTPCVYEMAAMHIRARREDLKLCERALEDPQDASGHHQLRIAAKRLRYTLEICNSAYDGQLAEVIKAVKQVQSLLGDIHDCDVWAQEIETFIEQERLKTIEYHGHGRPFNRLRPGLLFLRDERLTHRRQTFTRLLEYWQELHAQQPWETLENTLESHLETTSRVAPEPQDERTDGAEEQNDKDRPAQ